MNRIVAVLTLILLFSLCACAGAGPAESGSSLRPVTSVFDEKTDAAQPTGEPTDAGSKPTTLPFTEPETDPTDAETGTDPTDTEPEDTAVEMTVHVGEQTFAARLEQNETALAFTELFPCAFTMQELNGNEKYAYLPAPLPSAPEAVGRIEAGDLMLFGDNCLVVFYQSFDTPYSYTRIGKIADPSGLAQAVGDGNTTIGFRG